MANLRWTEEATRWLETIYRHISEDNPQAAQKVAAGIYEKCQILQSFPQAGSFYRTESDGEIRILLYGHYRVAYLLRDSGDIEILGIFHTALNIKYYL